MHFISKLRMALSAGGPKLLRDLISLFSGQGFSMVISFFAFAYVARQMSAEDYGLIEVAISIAAFGALVIECGVGTIGVRELARRPDQAAQIASQAVVARLIMAALVLPIAAIAAYYSAPDRAALILLMLFVISLIAAPFKQEWLLQGHDLMHQAAAAQPIRMLAFTLGVFLFVRAGSNPAIVGWIELVAVGLVTFYYFFAQYRWTVRYVGGWRIKDAFYFLKEGVAVGLSNILWAFMLYAPIYLLVSLTDATEAAWLGASNRIVISLLTLSFIYHFNLYPVITKLVKADVERWKRLISSSIRLVSWGGVALALPLALYSSQIAALVFGPKFSSAGPALAILVWALPLRMVSGHSRWSLIAAGQQKYLLQAEVVAAVTLLAVAILAIPSFGAAAAASSFVAAIAISFALTHYRVGVVVASLPSLLPAAIPFVLGMAILSVANVWALEPIERGVLAIVAYGVGLACFARTLYADLVRLAYAKEGNE